MSPAIRRAVAQITGVDADHTADAIAIIRRVMGNTPEGIAAIALLEGAPANEPVPESGPRLEVLDLRASRMPIAFACPGSIRRPTLRISETGEAAELGTAAHEALQAVVEGREPEWDRIPELAERHDVDPEELRMLVAMGTKLFRQVADSFPNAMTEASLEIEVEP